MRRGMRIFLRLVARNSLRIRRIIRKNASFCGVFGSGSTELLIKKALQFQRARRGETRREFSRANHVLQKDKSYPQPARVPLAVARREYYSGMFPRC